MKKIIAALSSVIAVVVLCVCMTACSTGIEGTWKFSSSSYTYEGQTKTMKVGDKVGPEGQQVEITADYMVLEVKGDGTFTMTKEGHTENGKWEKKDGAYVFTTEGEYAETMTGKIDGKTLVFEEKEGENSSKTVLKK